MPWPRFFDFEKYDSSLLAKSQARSYEELLTDPDLAPESAKSISTSRTGLHACDRVVTLRENASTSSSLVLLLVLIS